jgi:hypothetical protein
MAFSFRAVSSQTSFHVKEAPEKKEKKKEVSELRCVPNECFACRMISIIR